MKHLIFDPIDFQGGSKTAVASIYSSEDTTSMVLSNDSVSWSAKNFITRGIWMPRRLGQCVHGIPFLIKHVIYALQTIYCLLNKPTITTLIATSGPGVDLGLYIARAVFSPLKKLTVIQLIQGPVAASRMSARCLRSADKVFYLENTRPYIEVLEAMSGSTEPLPKKSKFELMKNGIAQHNWPSVTESSQPGVFWAASNLKWKGLDILIAALKQVNEPSVLMKADICYINATDQGYDVSETKTPVNGINWYESPSNLDEIRRSNSIFISTSKREPFGLSILEALAAGLCVVIPSDGAYWDHRLIHNKNCIKYTPGDASDLAHVLRDLQANPNRLNRIALTGKLVAQQYRASVRYKNIRDVLFPKTNYANENSYQPPIGVKELD